MSAFLHKTIAFCLLLGSAMTQAEVVALKDDYVDASGSRYVQDFWGVVIRPGYVFTVAHGLPPARATGGVSLASSIPPRQATGTYLSNRGYNKSDKYRNQEDVALLRIPTPGSYATTQVFVVAPGGANLPPGSKVYYLRGRHGQRSETVLGYYGRNGETDKDARVATIIVTDNNGAAPNDSGSPLYTEDGKLLGVMVGGTGPSVWHPRGSVAFALAGTEGGYEALSKGFSHHELQNILYEKPAPSIPSPAPVAAATSSPPPAVAGSSGHATPVVAARISTPKKARPTPAKKPASAPPKIDYSVPKKGVQLHAVEPFITPLGEECLLTFVAPGWAVTVAHCLDKLQAPTVELTRNGLAPIALFTGVPNTLERADLTSTVKIPAGLDFVFMRFPTTNHPVYKIPFVADWLGEMPQLNVWARGGDLGAIMRFAVEPHFPFVESRNGSPFSLQTTEPHWEKLSHGAPLIDISTNNLLGVLNGCHDDICYFTALRSERPMQVLSAAVGK